MCTLHPLQDLKTDLKDDILLLSALNISTFAIWDCYKLSPTSDWIAIDFAIWTNQSGFQYKVSNDKWSRRRNLHGYQFRTATLESSPYITALTPSETQGYTFHGMFAEVFTNLEVALITLT